MKNFLVAVAIFASSIISAQQEITVDLADALAMKTLEVSYEYYLSDQSSVGISGLFNFEGRSSDFRYNEDNMITPYFRHYFTSSRNWNYFGEIFLGINSGKEEIELDGAPNVYENYTDGALGVAIGTKYISNGGFVVSVLGGIGRNMFTDKSPVVVPRVGLNLGYRF
ncbi:DUF3575 domain-containing protein [Tenacibaculum sp. IB213877]|uniref:DUF3575 domain-containing protein n=1 Tax=Tenacibaculum sp. IB213877 TaxID=3097351 RepID=UPI002A598453|nr:DUF3575 domain-containing protein [Tenacibaculum sp. IB213877]MDY0780340.1 DUF3575 domain-containing protein [Tenacibaculum sp. IB213877]